MMKSPENQISDWSRKRILALEAQFGTLLTHNQPNILPQIYSEDFLLTDLLELKKLLMKSRTCSGSISTAGMSWSQRLRPLGLAARVL